MLTKIKETLNIFKNMGWGYTRFRIKHELMRRSGLLKNKFPVTPIYKQYISLAKWKEERGTFFFNSKEKLHFRKNPSRVVEERFQKIREGKFIFFNSQEFHIQTNYDWLTNPDSKFSYDVNKHWTEIPDYSKEAGDIKYVWEKSRFSYLYDIIRYDYHFQKDCSAFVFSEIISWINANPINQGPNYRCSQEISLRVLNWTFAIYYYSYSPNLTQKIFDQIQFAIFWQMDHVHKNINFSRIAVRNNHAITETLSLYLIGLLYPQFPDSEKWKSQGKQWFEEEIAYQIYEDGTFLQFSMNYHRVVVQLLTWAIVLSEKNGGKFSDVVYQRAGKSVEFLRTCMADENGNLPNYGANDGALFFKLNDADYSDYRPSLSALAKSLNVDLEFHETEDELWYGIVSKPINRWIPYFGIHSFDVGGFYAIREPKTLTFIRCGNHKDRPSQADNLHLDIWYQDKNILFDAGSYKYNTSTDLLNYFMGTASHNTVMLDEYNQMKKGTRFIWYHWSQSIFSKSSETEDSYIFEGEIAAFTYLDKSIRHKRKITKLKNKPEWIVEDFIINKPAGTKMKQLFHPIALNTFSFRSIDQTGEEVKPIIKKGYQSKYYGIKVDKQYLSFDSNSNFIKTILTAQ
ncbi:MAG: alginate lyase family protein [Ginsengibacter sp.]